MKSLHAFKVELSKPGRSQLARAAHHRIFTRSTPLSSGWLDCHATTLALLQAVLWERGPAVCSQKIKQDLQEHRVANTTVDLPIVCLKHLIAAQTEVIRRWREVSLLIPAREHAQRTKSRVHDRWGPRRRQLRAVEQSCTRGFRSANTCLKNKRTSSSNRCTYLRRQVVIPA
jgi:hypothetical protein